MHSAEHYLHNIIFIIFSKGFFYFCHLKIKTGLFFNDLKFKSGLTQDGKKDVI